jgi:predicted RNase H-like nuclease (RuvC/YqgF family)
MSKSILTSDEWIDKLKQSLEDEYAELEDKYNSLKDENATLSDKLELLDRERDQIVSAAKEIVWSYHRGEVVRCFEGPLGTRVLVATDMSPGEAAINFNEGSQCTLSSACVTEFDLLEDEV